MSGVWGLCQSQRLWYLLKAYTFCCSSIHMTLCLVSLVFNYVGSLTNSQMYRSRHNLLICLHLSHQYFTSTWWHVSSSMHCELLCECQWNQISQTQCDIKIMLNKYPNEIRVNIPTINAVLLELMTYLKLVSKHVWWNACMYTCT